MATTPERSGWPAAVMSRSATRFAPELLYLLSGFLVLFGGHVLARYLTLTNRCTGHHFGYRLWLSNWDGQWYQYIAHRGYHYLDSGGYGPQVFFPLYPMLGRLLDAVSPLYGQWPLIAVSWMATYLFCKVWMRYAAVRSEGDAPGMALWGLALILLFPVAYFLRVAYTEALYIFLLALFFYGCAVRWPIAALVLVTGLLTATRPTAIIVSVVLAFHVLLRADDERWPRRVLKALGVGAVSAWGLYAYMAYLEIDFGDPLLFVTRQQAWNYRMPADVFLLRWQEMLSLRPAWGFLVDGSLLQPATYAWNLQNKGLWLSSIALIAVGIVKRWLTAEETLFCCLTVALVYYTHGPKNMESVGRYIFTIVPLYLVLGRLLVALPRALRLLLLGLSAILLTVQSAHFRLWHCVF